MWNNAHPAFPGAFWGPSNGTWRLATSGGGWEGTLRAHPWVDWVKWPRAFLVTATGNGFGQYKNMQIKWTMQITGLEPTEWQFHGEISENSK